MSKPRVSLLLTGGTLGMEGRRPRPLHPGTYLRDLVAVVPEIEGLAEVQVELLWNMDSSNIGPEHWQRLAARIVELRQTGAAHGVVVIHGTDTMAYTGSALSFLLGGLDRPVVLTGSQRPLGEIRSDARMNLVNAVELATADVPEVSICFGSHLLRANRTTKVDVQRYEAFESPNHPPLARIGVSVELSSTIRRPLAGQLVALRGALNPRVICVRLSPGMPGAALLGAVRGGGAAGLVLAAFGSGNVPTLEPSVLDALSALRDDGIPVVITSQTLRGGVDLGLYECGQAARSRGAISAGSMTIEAAVTKLMWALGTTPDHVEETMGSDVAGELASVSVGQG